MNINYSINNSVLMMMSEFMITAFVIVILFVIVLVYNKVDWPPESPDSWYHLS
ncbi:hypothetical protein SK37_04882 [Citrobacter sp. MGH109]|nr:hypothetical protein SK37_04882 [Citrobacter sp. MGH109]